MTGNYSAMFGSKVASIVVVSSSPGECVERLSICGSRQGCGWSLRLSVVGGTGSNSFPFTYYGWEVDQNVAYEDVGPEDYVAGGSGQTGTGGQSPAFGVQVGCLKKKFFEVSIQASTAGATLVCNSCPITYD